MGEKMLKHSGQIEMNFSEYMGLYEILIKKKIFGDN